MGKREDYISKMGYRDDSPFNKRKFIDINTPNGVIDMSKSGRTLRATDSKGKTKVLKPYSGQHQFAPGIVREELIEEEFDDAELTDEEIADLRAQGYEVEELPKAQTGINGTLEPITLDDNPTDNMDPSGSGMNMDIEGIRNNLSPFIRDYVPYKDLQNAYFWEKDQENHKPKLTYGNPNSMSNGGQLPTAQNGAIHVTDPNDPGYIANKDSADVFQKQQQFNSQFLSNFPSIPMPAGDKSFDFDLMKVFMELKAKAGDPVNSEKDRKAFVAGAKEVWKSMLAAPKTVDKVIGPWLPSNNNDSYKETLKKYERNMQGQGVTTPTVLRSGDYTPNSEANWWNTDDSPHKQNVIKRGLGYGQNYSVNTIDPYTEFEREGKNWLTGETALNKLESHGLSHNEVKHPTIKPIGHMRWHAALPGYIGKKNTHLTSRPGTGATSGFNKVDPESTISGYEDANFYNISLPYYKAPVQKYILDEPPVVNTTLTKIPKPIPRTEASFERERKRDETEDLMEELTKLGLYTGPIRGRGAEDNKEWKEALLKYENKEVVSSTPKTLKKPKVTFSREDEIVPRQIYTGQRGSKGNKVYKEQSSRVRREVGGPMNPYACGGTMRHADGGNLSNTTVYNGMTHEQGGLPLGNTNNEVEDGEVRWDNGGDSYIFSNRF